MTESTFGELAQDGSGATADAGNSALCAIGRQFQSLARKAGLDFFLVTRFPLGDRIEFAANHLLSNWPRALIDGYDASDMFGISTLVSRLKDSILPAFCRKGLFSNRASKLAEDLDKAFLTAGLQDNLAFSLHDAELNQYIFVFSGTKERLEQSEISALYFGCMELLDTCFNNIRAQEGPRERLSARELECLKWSAAGKSSEEIAIILGISAHTVVSYLKSVMRKLDAVNRMQAVARACRYRLL
ncbi:LuxR family transcriptional regulator [Rhizobium sp. CG5]|uniref:helix-turn-helix transcriptional regulator n=1 Tax=Rhizobium sp. CG5 TaxID=2726076 RepID=UPI00203402C2|nr:LuxR family transcriptional regulator [Rhizobium sp. CG5]MCM2473259.1 LuxR family transcriptional regulator [Rhizobium sp. CG5]